MAKKETKAAAAAPANGTAPATNAPATGGVERGSGDLFVRVYKDGKPVEIGKMPPQAKVIVNAVEAAGKTGIKRAELVKNLTGVLVTRQPVGRIVSYYTKLLKSSGTVEIKDETPAAAAAA
jgi:hypothetical protein